MNTAGYVYSGGRLDPQEDYVFKVDHRFNDSNTVFARYAWGAQDTVNDTTNTGEPRFPGLPPWVNTERRPRNLAASYRRVITPSLVNEVVGGYNHFTFNFINPEAAAQPFSLVTINPSDPLDFSVGNLRRITTVQLVDNLSYNRGAHLLKGGVNFRYQQHKDERGSIGGQNANRIVNIAGSGQTNTSCTVGRSARAAPRASARRGRSSSVCRRPGRARPPSSIRTTDALQTTINDLLGRVGTVTQGFAATPDLFGYLPAGSLFLNDARYRE